MNTILQTKIAHDEHVIKSKLLYGILDKYLPTTKCYVVVGRSAVAVQRPGPPNLAVFSRRCCICLRPGGLLQVVF